MRRLVALALTPVLLLGVAVPTAHAGAATNAALGLASFAVFNQVVAPFLASRPHHFYRESFAHRVVVYQTPVVYPSAVVYQAPVVYLAPVATAATPAVTVVQYPHGRYELRGDGVTVAYQWVWIPSVPPVPPPPPIPPPAPAAPPAAPTP